ncbi:ABC transporter ATP-binding protein [[Clostridium] polysaccharolyticum]|uniref:Putative ABC transport system ATP-binding protein n=1 Tax=[Clostridium] polysaccharolyticum TaxID=29364 RepID=A0A1I0AE42_9FIRM|nr:ABC transporter ATP-binding protein [[Clostridium] polysaccharolyticum]SES92467.1 putative ABC transport system ATP-binding protein [[Clostridium] polysaccharolyticum]
MFIELNNLTKKYGSKDTLVYALNNVSLEIEQSEIVIILGPSGSGKSTLLNVLGGIDSADTGTFRINNKVISDMNERQLTEYRREDVGFVFQSYNLIPDLTVEENIQVVSDISQNNLDTQEVLEALELSNFRFRFPKELSGGQQQRVAVARALIKNPQILLCDEMTGALDSKSSENVLRLIENINQKFHTTIIIVTHNEAMKGIADRIILVKDGKIQSNTKNDHKISAKELKL